MATPTAIDTTSKFGPVSAEMSKVAEAAAWTSTKEMESFMMSKDMSRRRFTCAPSAKHSARRPNRTAKESSLNSK